ncbi:MAG: energy-coupling factor ABC transporter permease, partial [Phycisphaerae bacterium]
CLMGGAVRRLWSRPRPGWPADVATFLGSLVAVLAGATCVILFFGVSGALPAKVTLIEALAAMDFVHFFIGLVEGATSVAVVRFVVAARREAVFEAEEPALVKEAA